MTRAEKLARATAALSLLVKRLHGSLDISVFRYDMLMRSILLLATNMQEATMASTPSKRARATAVAFERAESIIRSKNLLELARLTSKSEASLEKRARRGCNTRAVGCDADYKRAAQQARMYDIPDEAYLKAMAAKSVARRRKKAHAPKGK